jgi:hypothetical protein
MTEYELYVRGLIPDRDVSRVTLEAVASVI